VKPKRSSQPKSAVPKPDKASDNHTHAGPFNEAEQDDTTYSQVVKPKRQQKAVSTPKVVFFNACFGFCNLNAELRR